MLFLVMIKDKNLPGEPDIALAVVEVTDEEAANLAAEPTLELLAQAGRARCVSRARGIEPGKFYRLGALIQPPG
jgi:hypothetical protein